MALLGEAEAREADELLFFVNGRRIVEKNADPEQMLLSYLRKRLHLVGTKYGCGGGGCGACTVMISRYEPVTKKIMYPFEEVDQEHVTIILELGILLVLLTANCLPPTANRGNLLSSLPLTNDSSAVLK